MHEMKIHLNMQKFKVSASLANYYQNRGKIVKYLFEISISQIFRIIFDFIYLSFYLLILALSIHFATFPSLNMLETITFVLREKRF